MILLWAFFLVFSTIWAWALPLSLSQLAAYRPCYFPFLNCLTVGLATFIDNCLTIDLVISIFTMFDHMPSFFHCHSGHVVVVVNWLCCSISCFNQTIISPCLTTLPLIVKVVRKLCVNRCKGNRDGRHNLYTAHNMGKQIYLFVLTLQPEPNLRLDAFFFRGFP